MRYLDNIITKIYKIMESNKFTNFISGLFSDETKDVKEVEAELEAEPTIAEVAEVVEEIVELVTEEKPDYILRSDVEEMISSVVKETVIAIEMSQEKALKTSEEANKALTERLIKMESELATPAKKAEVVIPAIEGEKKAHWSMMSALAEKRNK